MGEQLPELMQALRKRCGHTRVFDISVATRYHVNELMKRVFKWHKAIVKDDWKLRGAPAEDAEHVVDRRQLTQLGASLDQVSDREVLELDPERPKGSRMRKGETPARVIYDVLEDAWRLKHPEVERVARVTNWDMLDAGDRFNRVCKATGMTEAMSNQGIEEGDDVIVGSHKFHYQPSKVGGESRMLIYDMN